MENKRKKLTKNTPLSKVAMLLSDVFNPVLPRGTYTDTPSLMFVICEGGNLHHTKLSVVLETIEMQSLEHTQCSLGVLFKWGNKACFTINLKQK